MTSIGILGLQGDVAEHALMLTAAGTEPVIVKQAEQLAAIDGLVIPGGESTTIGKLLRRFHLLDPLRELVARRFPLYGTCAGMILLAGEIEDAAVDQPVIGGMDITVRRNAFGRQRESFETALYVPAVGVEPLAAIFIRAPLITRIGPEVEVLSSLPDGRVVAARQGNLLVTSFHPELMGDARMHRYFLDLVERAGIGAGMAVENSRRSA